MLGGVLCDAFSWRACFGISLPLVAISIAIMAFLFQDPLPNPDRNLSFKDKFAKLDVLGTVFLVPSITCLLLALQWGGLTFGWVNARIIVLFVVFAILLAAFSWLQHRRQDKATIPLRILRQRSILGGAWVAACCNSCLAVVEYYMAIYLQAVKGYSAAQSGILSLPQIAGLTVAGLSAGIATTWMGYYMRKRGIKFPAPLSR